MLLKCKNAVFVVIQKNTVMGDENALFRFRLSDQDPVKWILISGSPVLFYLQIPNPKRMGRLYV